MPGNENLTEAFDYLSLFRIESVLLLIIGFGLLIYIAKKFREFVSRIQRKYPDQRLSILQIATVITFVWYIFGSILIVYGAIRPPKEVLLGLGGSAAVAIGLALKDIVASLISGVVLLFDRPFQVGDRVKFKDVYGEISHIGLRAVRLVTLDDSLITIPNSEFTSNYVSSGNSGALDMMIEIPFHLATDVDIDKIKEVLYEIAITSRYAYLKKPVSIVISEVTLGYSVALIFTVKAYVFDVTYEKAFQTDIVTRAYKYFQKQGINRPNSHFLVVNEALNS